MINTGDHVLIARKESWWSGWVFPMDVCVGEEGVVTSVHRDSGDSYYYGVRTRKEEHSWNYPLASLDLLEPFLPGHGPNNRHLSQELPP